VRSLALAIAHLNGATGATFARRKALSVRRAMQDGMYCEEGGRALKETGEAA
jgi:hypothetical protein